ncbi:MAG: 2-phosphosulfolactate phosphatase, partial [Halanaerobiales bacterium]
PFTDINSVQKYYNSIKFNHNNYITAGEKEGKKYKDFSLGNSPLSYNQEKIKNKTILLKTSNGTKVLNKLNDNNKIYIGALVNCKSLINRLVTYKDNVYLVCAGRNGTFSLEDFFTAGRFCYLLKQRGYSGDDLTIAAARIYKDNSDYEDIIKLFFHSDNGQNLLRLGYKKDIKYAAQKDIFSEIPYLKNHKIII